MTGCEWCGVGPEDECPPECSGGVLTTSTGCGYNHYMTSHRSPQWTVRLTGLRPRLADRPAWLRDGLADGFRTHAEAVQFVTRLAEWADRPVGSVAQIRPVL